MGFTVVWGFGFRVVWGLGLRVVWDSRFRFVWGLGFRFVWGSGFRVWSCNYGWVFLGTLGCSISILSVYLGPGSSDDHERRGTEPPDELSDILRSLTDRQVNILYATLTNSHVP